MKKKDIKIGQCYICKVSGKPTIVKVTATWQRRGYGPNARETTVFDGVNQTTGRKVTGYTAAKFRHLDSVVCPKCKHQTAVHADTGKLFCHYPDNKSETTEFCSGSGKTITEAAKRHTDPTESLKDKSNDSGTPAPELPKKTKPTVVPTNASTKSGTTKPETIGSGMADRLRSLKTPTQDTAPHLVIEARAGTGKTTTLIEGLKVIKGMPVRITPSPQQAAIWEALAESRNASTICFVAFNKSIADELQSRVPQGCEAMTMHSLGYKTLRNAYADVFNGQNRKAVNSYRVQDILSRLLSRDIFDLRRDKPLMVKAVEELVGLCKQNLVECISTGGCFQPGCQSNQKLACAHQDELANLASYYDVDLNSEAQEIFELVPRVLEECKNVQRDRCIDYNDMIWLPLVLDLPVTRYDLLLIDESQDLNRCQQELARRAGSRLVVCGDPKQSIYGFAGADCQSMTRLEQQLRETERGCTHLPLTVTRRCGKAIVAEARKLVHDFEAHESNSEGIISSARLKWETKEELSSGAPVNLAYNTKVEDGDMILCRCNAPLVSECFRFLKAGRKATIQGRDVGQGLVNAVKKLLKIKQPEEYAQHSTVELIMALGEWLFREQSAENAKRNPSDARLINLQDKHDCLLCFCEGSDNARQIIDKIDAIFTNDKDNAGIRLSSVHKAKGLEAKRVFILMPENAPMPHPMAKQPWEREQEMNIKYVAITRAIEELVYVT